MQRLLWKVYTAEMKQSQSSRMSGKKWSKAIEKKVDLY